MVVKLFFINRSKSWFANASSFRPDAITIPRTDKICTSDSVRHVYTFWLSGVPWAVLMRSYREIIRQTDFSQHNDDGRWVSSIFYIKLEYCMLEKISSYLIISHTRICTVAYVRSVCVYQKLWQCIDHIPYHKLTKHSYKLWKCSL